MKAFVPSHITGFFAAHRKSDPLEAGSIGWALAQAWGLTALAWIVTFVVHQGGLLLGLGGLAGGL